MRFLRALTLLPLSLMLLLTCALILIGACNLLSPSPPTPDGQEAPIEIGVLPPRTPVSELEQIRLTSVTIPAGSSRRSRVWITLPPGIAGLDWTLTLSPPGFARFEGIASTKLAFRRSTTSDTEWRLATVDLARAFEPGVANAELFAIVVRGLAPGSATLSIAYHTTDDDAGFPLDLPPVQATVEVTAAVP